MVEAILPVDMEPEEARTPRTMRIKGLTDCHFHIFGGRDRYPLSLHRLYEPADAPVSRYQRMAGALGIERAVVVTGSPYGTDNRCTLDAIATLGMPARGVAVIPSDITDPELAALHDGGIRGVRINFITGRTPFSDLIAIVDKIRPFGMHLQLWVSSDHYQDLLKILDRIDVPLVIDHMGQVPAAMGREHPHVRTLLTLLESDRVWIKLIGYRISGGPPYDDLAVLAGQLLDVAEDRCVWGTDWPHPFLGRRPMPNDADLLDLLASWCSQSQLSKVLAGNPSRLYGFDG